MAKRLSARRNPMRRSSDRIEAWLTAAVIMTILLITPWFGWWAGRATYQEDVRMNAWEMQHRVQVTAVLLQDVVAKPGPVSDAQPPAPMVLTPAQWTDSNGVVHTGSVLAGAGMDRGSTMTIWVDDQGIMAEAPARRNPALDAAATSLVVMGCLVATLLGLRRIGVWELDRRRLQSWQAEWDVVGPRWSHR